MRDGFVAKIPARSFSHTGIKWTSCYISDITHASVARFEFFFAGHAFWQIKKASGEVFFRVKYKNLDKGTLLASEIGHGCGSLVSRNGPVIFESLASAQGIGEMVLRTMKTHF